MKYLIIPDVHGHNYWKDFINTEGIDKVIFLGDYFDSYGDVTREDEINNFKDILEYKKENKDKVELLLGNHDLNQYILNENMSRKSYDKFETIRNLLLDNIDSFNMVFKAGEYILSHAGISKAWWEWNKVKNLEDINERFHNGEYSLFKWHGASWDIYGESDTQSPTWLRPETLVKNAKFPKQIVGHTRIDNDIVKLVNGDTEIIVVETGPQDKKYILEV